jgi:DNA (cytosine-5)-methyltransferase 1
MSWLFSRVLVEEYSEAICSDGELSALLSGNNTPQAFCAPDKMMGFSRLSQFGMTYKPLMESRGEALLMLYLEAFHAKTFQPRGGGAGIDGERSGMWREMARIICEVQPRFVFVENSPMLTSRGLGRVLGDLATMGFDARWGVLGAADVGANHQRDRIWIVAKQRNILSHALHNRIGRRQQQQKSIKKTITADTRCKSERPDKGLQPTSQIPIGQDASIICGKVSNTTSLRQSGQGQHEQPISSKASSDWQTNIIEPIGACDFWATEPNVGRVVDGMAARVDRLKAIGNGQVPLCAATAWKILSERI